MSNEVHPWLVEALSQIKRDQTDMRKDMGEMGATLAAQHVSLETHIKRTDILERRVDGMWLRVLSVVGGLVGIAAGLAKLLGWA